MFDRDGSSPRHGRPWLLVGCLGIYLLLVVLAATGDLDGLDRSVLDLCLRHRDAGVVAAAKRLTDVVTPLVDVAVLGASAAGIAWLRRRPRTFLVAAAVAWAMALVVVVTKEALGRPSPATPSVMPARGGSFPSGHTASFLVCFGVLALLVSHPLTRRRRTALAAVGLGTAVVAAALVYAGFHWFSDTLASAVLGVALLDLQRRYLRS